MNVSRSRTDVKMHQINIKTSMKLSELFESPKLSKSSKLPKSSEKSSKTPTDQILNEMNDLNSKYFESSQTPTSTSANITNTARIFSDNLIQILATNEFD